MTFLESFNKIAGKKKKLKFDPRFTQEEFAKYVKKKADHIYESGYADGEPKDYTWRYDPQFPLDFALKIRTPEQWKQWFESESAEFTYNHGKQKRDGHFDRWSESPALKPIILAEGTDGKLHIWDGHHRTAKLVGLDEKIVPALIGTRTKK